LGSVALLWILALAKARSAAPISSVISAKRATQANAKINATVVAILLARYRWLALPARKS
jgi:hypothetical protein